MADLSLEHELKGSNILLVEGNCERERVMNELLTRGKKTKTPGS